MGVSRDRVVRMRAIGQHLADSDYDIACLQEVWCPEDFLTITSLAREKLPFHHFFDHGIIGSGTAILCRVPVVDAAFHEFSLNGYPHKILHGDWFAGKGIGVCNIDFKGLSINVFVSHFHAEYNRRSDIYVGHRVMQALEAAQWIKLTSAGADLTIYAGDFNTEPSDTPYWLLRTVGRLRDSWLEVHKSEAGGQTCDTGDNTYCSQPGGLGKRIDYIMFRPGRGAAEVGVVSARLPLSRRIPASMSARLGREVSYSDHEAVHSVLQMTSGGQGESSSEENHSSLESKQTIERAIELIDRAQTRTSFDQKFYSVLALIISLAFIGTFSQLLDLNSLLLECFMFATRMILSLSGTYTICMATLFNRRERNALLGTRSTLILLQKQNRSYGSL